jgi:hypothetical protein
MQTRIHVKVVGLVLILRGHVPACMLSRMEPEPKPFWNVAGTLGLANGFRAARTLDVQVCSTNLATVDTTYYGVR